MNTIATQFRHKFLSALVLGSTAALTLSSCGVAQPDLSNSQISNEGSLFLPLAQSQAAMSLQNVEPNDVSFVAIDFAYFKRAVDQALMNAHSAAQPQTLSQIQVTLNNGQLAKLNVDQVEAPSADNAILTGEIDGDPESSFTLVMNGDALVGNIRRGGETKVYEVRFKENGVHSISAVDDEAEGKCEDGKVIDEDSEMIEDQADSSALSAEMSAEMNVMATPVIRMFVAYTPAALAQQGSVSAMEALIQLGIADTNRTFNDSQINLRVELAGTMQVASNETGNFTRDLSSLKSRVDGKWDDVHQARIRTRADQVTLIGSFRNNGGVTGIGYFNARYDSAFTVVKASSFGQYTFTHELGHNLGLDHSDGYVNSSGRFRTIMAYGSRPRIRRFSSPALKYNGYATGDGRHNSAAIVRKNAGKIAGLFEAMQGFVTP